MENTLGSLAAKQEDMLDREAELALVRRFKSGDESAFTELSLHFLPLIKSVASKVQKPYYAIEDAVQDGFLILRAAMASFQEELGFRFSTYLRKILRNNLSRNSVPHRSLLKFPKPNGGNVQALYYGGSHAVRKEERRLNRTLTYGERVEFLMEKYSATRDTVEGVLLIFSSAKSLDEPLLDGETTLADMIPDDNQIDVSNLIDADTKLKIIHQAIKTLSPKEQYVIAHRFGLAETTLDAIGEEFNISRQRVQQIEVKALNKVKYFISKQHPLLAKEIVP